MTTGAIRVWADVETRLRQADPSLVSLLPSPASERDFAALESALGTPLPTLVRELYSIHNGIGMPAVVEERGERYAAMSYLLSLSDALDTWRSLASLAKVFEKNDTRVVTQGPVRPRWWHPAWLPISSSSSGDCYCVDLDPAPGGTRGQIVNFWHDSPEREVSYPDLGRFLVDHLDEHEWATVRRQRLVAN